MSMCSHGDGLWHDCEYIEARNRLIPQAEEATNAILGEEPKAGPLEKRQAWRVAWTRHFFAEMNRLARATGLVR